MKTLLFGIFIATALVGQRSFADENGLRSFTIATIFTSLIPQDVVTAPVMFTLFVGGVGLTLSAENSKAIVEANEDALMYVVSEGEVVGAKLISVVNSLREEHVELQDITEATIAYAIAGM